MKKFLPGFIIAVSIVMMVGIFTASAETYGDLSYKISGGMVTITDCNTSVTSVTIPSEINGYPVIRIESKAFYNCTSLASITIPDSVTTIGDYAFYICESLESITIGDSVTTIGDYAFNGCTSLASITIPDSVTTIGNYAFYNCKSLKSITIGDGVTTIGDRAFYNTAYYNDSSNWSDGILYIGNYLIDAKTTITSANVKQTAKTIAVYAFYNCTSLASITIPDSVTTIGERAFYNCTSLASITIPDSVTTIGDYAFYNCTSLESITIGDGVTTIGDYAFYICESLESITIGDGVTTIGERAFYNCTSLASITIPDSVTTIGDYAFYICESLESITIGDSVTTIGDDAFYKCQSLESITIPDSVVSIVGNVFIGCQKLKEITVDSDNDFYSSVDGVLFDKKKELLITYPVGREATEYKVPGTVTEIGAFAFCNCSDLTVTIPKSVTTINVNANSFGNFNNLTINCEKGSYAQSYAAKNNIPYNIVEISGPTVSGEVARVNGKIVIFAEPSITVSTECLHIALYDDKNTMVDYMIVPAAKPLDHINVVFEDNKNASYAKIFLWSSMESLEPISEATRVDIK